MKKFTLALGLVALLPATAFAAENYARPITVRIAENTNVDRSVTLYEAKKTVRDLLTTQGQNRYRVGEATRKGDSIKVLVTDFEGIPVMSYTVDGQTGEVLG